MWVQNYESISQVYKLGSKDSGRTVASLLNHQDYTTSSKRKRGNVGAELWVLHPGLQAMQQKLKLNCPEQQLHSIRTTLPVVKERGVMWVQGYESTIKVYQRKGWGKTGFRSIRTALRVVKERGAMWVQNYESIIQVYKLCSKGSGRTVVSLLIYQDYPINSKRKRGNVGAELWAVYKLCSKGSGRTVVSLLNHQDYPTSSKRKMCNVGAGQWVQPPGLQTM